MERLWVDLLEQEVGINIDIKWDTLGSRLGLREGEIRELECDHRTTECRRRGMFDRWLRKEANTSWERIITALESMDEKSLASRLRDKYAMQPHQEDTTTPNVASDPTLERVLKVDRKDQVAKEMENLKESYARLVMSAESALEAASPSPRQLKRFSQLYTSSRVTTVEELFDCLGEFSFLDYALLENTITMFLKETHRVVSNLNDYIQQLNNFMKSTTLSEFMETIVNAQKSLEGTGACTVTLRLVAGWLPKTMEDLQKLLKEIFQDKSSVLAHLKIISGSVIVTYLAPQSEADSLIQLAQAKLFFMIQVGVCELNIGSKRIIKSKVPHFSFESCLVLAVRNNDITLLTFLLNIRTCPDATDGEGWTALMRGSYSGRDKAVNLLVNAKADPNTQRHDGVTALYLAAQNGHSDVVDILLKAEANPNLPADDGTTPLDIARQNGHSNVVSTLQNFRTSEGAMKSFRATMAITRPIPEEVKTSRATTLPISEGEMTIISKRKKSTSHPISEATWSIFEVITTATQLITEGATAKSTSTTKTLEETTIKPSDQICEDEMIILDEDNLQKIFEEATKPQSVSIIMFGKSGSGKTSLSSAIANKEIDESTKGWDSSAKSIRRVRIQIGEGSVNILDTPGVADTNLIGIDPKLFDSKVVIIVCINMYEGLDESTLEALAQLHKTFVWDFWFQVIIVLTKADCYEKHKWLISQTQPETEDYLKITFSEELEKLKIILRKAFTATANQAPPHCHIGMTGDEFDDLQIPIIPTSQLNQQALERMEQVGHGYWFDLLLIKCCRRLQGSGLQIHRERLAQLPPQLLVQEYDEEEQRWHNRKEIPRIISQKVLDYPKPLTYMYDSTSSYSSTDRKTRFEFKL